MTKKRELTEEDINSIQYFLLEKGDVTRYVCWEEIRHSVKRHFPELIDAIKRLESAERTLNAIVKNLNIDDLEDEDDNEA
ncbi:MAG: hypothetical protein ACTSW7_01455 [Candidatus Thorarchaeota archaeon]|nr:hypothetical protein [Thermoplasmatales archaeon]